MLPKMILVVVLLAGCGTPQSRCEKYLKDFDRKAENCGIATKINEQLEMCARKPDSLIAEWKQNFGSVVEAETCEAMKLRWQRAWQRMIDDARRDFERGAAPSKEFDDAFRKALDDARKQ